MLRQIGSTIRRHLAPHALPDFVILGAQKAGTTSLYSYLCRHPQVAPATRKEVHYFDLNFSRGLDWYRGHFPRRLPAWIDAATGRRPIVTGEASPYYLFHPHVPARMAELPASVKFIVLLRDPVQRTYSHYQFIVRLGAETLSFGEALAAEPDRLRDEVPRLLADDRHFSFNHQYFSYVARSLYAEQIERWLNHIDRRRFLFLKSEDLFDRPAHVLAETASFLELAPFDFGATFPVENGNSYAALDRGVERRLAAFFGPHNRRLYELLGRDFGWGTAEASRADRFAA
jgi:hypothetical protein